MCYQCLHRRGWRPCCGTRNFLLAIRYAKFRPLPLAQVASSLRALPSLPSTSRYSAQDKYIRNSAGLHGDCNTSFVSLRLPPSPTGEGKDTRNLAEARIFLVILYARLRTVETPVPATCQEFCTNKEIFRWEVFCQAFFKKATVSAKKASPKESLFVF